MKCQGGIIELVLSFYVSKTDFLCKLHLDRIFVFYCLSVLYFFLIVEMDCIVVVCSPSSISKWFPENKKIHKRIWKQSNHPLAPVLVMESCACAILIFIKCNSHKKKTNLYNVFIYWRVLPTFVKGFFSLSVDFNTFFVIELLTLWNKQYGVTCNF